MKAKLFTYFILSFLLKSCCKGPSPEKYTYLNLQHLAAKDSLFLGKIEKIYAAGAKMDSLRYGPKNNLYFDASLPISYVADSTVYVVQYKNVVNDTIIINYNKVVSYDGGGKNCGYQILLQQNPYKRHYTSNKKWKLDVIFGDYGVYRSILNTSVEAACAITVYPNEK